ncbi:MAG: FG-GAP repeat protein, partial [Phycisphaerales bacterium]|nr:FG-GAP repeat protein [Phycisphaerales bacterium]
MVCAWFAVSAHAQICIPELFKLSAFDGSPVDIYGQSVAISGNVIVVGSYMDDTFGG